MFVSCWTAALLLLLLSAGNTSAGVDQTWLANIIKGIQNQYPIGNTFTIAVNVPQNQDPNGLQQLLQGDSAGRVQQSLSGGQVYRGAKVVAAAQLLSLLDNLQTLGASSQGNVLVLYSEQSPNTPDTDQDAVAAKAGAIAQSWRDYVFAFGTVGNAATDAATFKQLGVAQLGLDRIYRCYSPAGGAFQCSSCSAGGDVAPSCLSDQGTGAGAGFSDYQQYGGGQVAGAGDYADYQAGGGGQVAAGDQLGGAGQAAGGDQLGGAGQAVGGGQSWDGGQAVEGGQLGGGGQVAGAGQLPTNVGAGGSPPDYGAGVGVPDYGAGAGFPDYGAGAGAGAGAFLPSGAGHTRTKGKGGKKGRVGKWGRGNRQGKVRKGRHGRKGGRVRKGRHGRKGGKVRKGRHGRKGRRGKKGGRKGRWGKKGRGRKGGKRGRKGKKWGKRGRKGKTWGKRGRRGRKGKGGKKRRGL